MKPTRGLSRTWLSHLPRERRTALVALVFLIGLLGSLLLYQRLLTGGPPVPSPAPDSASGTVPGLTAGTLPSAAGTGRPEAVQAGAGPAGTTLTGAAADGGAVAVAGPLLPPPGPAPTRLLAPLDGARKVQHGYGWETSAVFRDYRLYPGIAWEAAVGEQVKAAADGLVVAVEEDPAYGRAVTLDNGGGMQTHYAGLGNVLVAANAKVKAGQPIADVGKPGFGEAFSGSYLHFEVQMNGEPVDPGAYLPR